MANEDAPKTEQEVIARYQQLQKAINMEYNQLATLDAEAAEHDLVIKQLEPMDTTRKCYRLIGDVMVERTVAEVLPAVKRNRAGLATLMQQTQTDLQQHQKELAALVTQHKIRAVDAGGPGQQEGDGGGSSGSRKPQQGKQAPGPSRGSKGVLA